MSGSIIIDGQFKEEARHKIAIMVGVLMGLKNIPPSVASCEAMAETLTHMLELPELFAITHGDIDVHMERRITWAANNMLDWDGAVHMIRIFRRVGNIGTIPDDVHDSLLGNMLWALKGENEVGADTVVWPSPSRMEELAKRALGPLRPIDLTALEASIIPHMALPPVVSNEPPPCQPGLRMAVSEPALLQQMPAY